MAGSLISVITDLSTAMLHTSEIVSDVARVAEDMTAVSHKAPEPDEVKIAYADIKSVVRTACNNIGKIDCYAWLGRSTEIQKMTTRKSLTPNDRQKFKCHIGEMQRSLAKAEEYYSDLKEECHQAVISCNKAGEACGHKAKEMQKKKKNAQIIGGTVATTSLAAAVIAGGVAIGVLTFGIGTTIAAGVTATVVGTMAGGTGVAGVGAAGTTVLAAERYDKATTAFSSTGSKCKVAGDAALRLERAIENVHSHLCRVSSLLDDASRYHNINGNKLNDDVKHLYKMK